MFVMLENLLKNILVEPRFFGPNLEECLMAKLKKEIEVFIVNCCVFVTVASQGTCSGEFGYMISVLGVSHIDKGRLQPMTGGALFRMKYNAIVFKPFVGEVCVRGNLVGEHIIFPLGR